MSRDVAKFTFFLVLFLVASAVVGWITPRDNLHTLGRRKTRNVWNERVHLPSDQPYRHSPFIVDQIFNQQSATIDLLENRGKWASVGSAHETFRCYFAGSGLVTVDFDITNADRTPRVWLYDDQNRLISIGESSLAAEQFSVRFSISDEGLYLIRMRFHYEDVESVRITGECPQATSDFEDYFVKNLKTLEIRMSLGQFHRLKELYSMVSDHWGTLSGGLKGRSLPSPKEAVSGQIRVENCSWAFAKFRLAGRNPAHTWKEGLPSLDVRLQAGSLPFGMSEFKLYTLESKTNGRDMLYESILNDRGLPMYRQDIVRVLLNGKDVGFAQLLEAVSPEYFEHAQVQEGAVLSYDTDALLAVPNRSRFQLRSYYRSKLFPADQQLDLSDPTFTRLVDETQMSIALSFAPAYAGNHGMTTDLRFHVNQRRGRFSPIVKDFNSGVYGVFDSRCFNRALMMLGTFAPSWRPHVATFSSYFVSRNAHTEAVDVFFWWNVLPTSLNFFTDASRSANVVRFLKKWDTPQSRRRIQARLDNLNTTLKLSQGKDAKELKNVPPMLDVIPHGDFVKLFDYEVANDRRLQHIKQMISNVSDNAVVPTNHDLNTFGWRNDLFGRRFSGNNVAVDDHCSFVTFLYRAEEDDSSHWVFLERQPPEPHAPPTSLVLLDPDGGRHKPTGYVEQGGQDRKVRLSNLYLNDVREGERVRLYYFRINRINDHQYFRPTVDDPAARYFGPHELAVYPSPKSITNEVSFLPLDRFFERDGNQLRWRADLAVVNGPIFIPAEMELVIPNSRTLKFGREGSLVVKGQMRILPDATLTLTSANEQEGWQGIHFHDNEDLLIERLRVCNVGNGQDAIQINGIKYSGAVTFANCRATLRQCAISNIRIEDALHCLRSEVTLDQLKVSNTQSDAIDADYCGLTIQAIDLNHVGVSTANAGDGFDVSGSFANVSDSTINDCGDKGISVGENSVIHINGTTIKNCHYGVAAKDGSLVNISRSRIEDCKIGVAKYIKKTAFTMPSVDVDGRCQFRRNRRDIEQVSFRSSPP